MHAVTYKNCEVGFKTFYGGLGINYFFVVCNNRHRDQDLWSCLEYFFVTCVRYFLIIQVSGGGGRNCKSLCKIQGVQRLPNNCRRNISRIQLNGSMVALIVSVLLELRY